MTTYQKFISRFIENGYLPDFFSKSILKKSSLIIRHDVDFDVEYAYRIALQENEIGVTSTFFFLVRSAAYNIFEKTNFDKIKHIINLGHTVSIHFDPTLYNDIETGLSFERDIFESAFDLKIEIISIHRPSEYFLGNPDLICGIPHTYNPIFFEQVKYYSDSQGIFRYGDPLHSEAFKKKDTIQLLIHPIWWMDDFCTPLDKLQSYLNDRIGRFESFMGENCLLYKKFLENKKLSECSSKGEFNESKKSYCKEN